MRVSARAVLQGKPQGVKHLEMKNMQQEKAIIYGIKTGIFRNAMPYNF